MNYVLGARSRGTLQGVHPALVRAVELAITITEQDFAVHCGCRTLEEQRHCVAAGTSWTLNSKHRTQADGFGHAVDLVPFIDGELRWEWPACYPIAAAMGEAAAILGVRLIWGGVWDRSMNDYDHAAGTMQQASAAYVARRRKLGRRAAIDGPHFELTPTYPSRSALTNERSDP